MNDASSQSSALRRWLPLAAPLLIVIAAISYYGSYLRFWFNPHDEGGTAALVAMRLMAGEAPVRDVDLGYNVGWFWPIVMLFKVTGVNFLVMRAYFFALSTITALLGWTIVRRLTRNEWLAFVVGLILVVFPGSQFKNYNPLFCVANMLCVLNVALGSGVSTPVFWRRLGLGGLVLGLTLLVRIDLGYLVAMLWLGLLALRLFDSRLKIGARFVDVIVALAILFAGVVVTQTPAVLAARAGGYEKEFGGQYLAWVNYITAQARTVTGVQKSAPVAKKPASAATASPIAKADRRTLPRMDWKTASSSHEADNKVLFLLTYAPPLLYALALAWALWNVLGAMIRRSFTLDQPATLVLLALVASMASFPQFFFFRPDRPHLSEFMPGYLIAMASAVVLIGARWRWLLVAMLVVQGGFYGWYALDHYSAGTIAARTAIKKNKRQLFNGANGVHVIVHKEKDYPELEGVRKTVVEHSKPGEWLVCYPYQPGYNVMADRPTYEREMYQDNATAPRGWARQAIARIEEKKPAVVVIDNRAINKLESSRFSVWAAPVYEHLRAHYEVSATFDAVEVFTRPATPKEPKP